jgi:anti-sigma factor RsiW
MSSVTLHDPLCERARAYVSLRFDGELSELEDALLDAHLSRCARCHEFAASVERMTAELRAAPPEVPSAAIAVPRRRYTAARALRVGAAAAVLAVAVFAGALESVLRNGQSTFAIPSPKVLARPGSEVRELRVLKREALEPGLHVSPALLRSLRLPGDS